MGVLQALDAADPQSSILPPTNPKTAAEDECCLNPKLDTFRKISLT
jgi:hypothetical protein